MARINNGIMGGFSGKVGTVVGYTRMGQACMRSLPRKSSKAPSEGQLINRKAMKSAMAWLKPINEYVRVGFQNYSAKQHGFGSAVSYNKLNALREDKTLDPSMAMIACGELPAPEGVVVSNPERGILEFTWPADIQNKDRVLILAYSNEKDIIGDLCGARRKEGKQVLDCGILIGKEADIYMAFVSEERDKSSNSVYLGRILVE
ncbi:DUF6266 family protein [Daejeonella sp.]|uniref:DUF6266 family protein n=1 Tax=Daejeonella sp. TaxID=2805397 RepID=UPI003983D1B7